MGVFQREVAGDSFGLSEIKEIELFSREHVADSFETWQKDAGFDQLFTPGSDGIRIMTTTNQVRIFFPKDESPDDVIKMISEARSQ